MAKEPKDRDEAKRSNPFGGGGGLGPLDAGDRSKRRDANEEAPRIQSAADDDASEEWILVDDDLVAAAAEEDSATLPTPDVRPQASGFKRDDEANRLVDDMKEAAADFGDVTSFGTRGEAAEPMAEAPEASESAPAPLEPQEATGGDGGEALAPAIEGSSVEEPALAPETDAPESEPEAEPEAERRSAPRVAAPPRRSMAAAAAILITAALGAGGWYAWKTWGSRFFPASSEVASAPTNVPAPAPKPAPKKPTVENPTPANPAPKKPAPDVAAKKPTPTDPKAAPNGASIPVIPVNPTPDPGSTAAATAPKVPTPAPTPKPASTKPATIVNTQLPIRPTGPLPQGTAAAKSSTAVKKNDTVIELKNGYTLRGSIKRVKDDQITLGVKGGEYTFSIADVKVLDSSAPEYRTESEMPAVSIVLKSGQRMRGKLLKASAERVVIVVDHGEMVIDRAQIREVSFTGRIHF